MAVSLDTLRRDMALRIAIRVDEEQVHHLTIAVRVPIVSGRADQDHIGDSVTEVLITELARLSPFKVIAHQSVLSYSADPPPLKQIGADLGIDTVIEGAIDTSGSRVW